MPTDLAKASKEDMRMRVEVIWILVGEWGKEDWIKELLITILKTPQKDSDVIMHARGTLGQFWPEMKLE